MIHPILLYGDPLLKQKSGKIPSTFPKQKLEELVNDMFETMHKAGGIGLSAIQIGIPFNIFVIEAHIKEENFHFRDIFINPIIRKEWGNLIKHPEGCLSVPQLTALIERPEKVLLQYYDLNWKLQEKTFDGYKARIIQHEYDHLQGNIYIDKADNLWKSALEEPLNLIEKRKIEVSYLTK